MSAHDYQDLKKRSNDLADPIKSTKQKLTEFWDKTFDEDGNFEFTFGDPKQTPFAVHVWVGYDENEEVIVDITHPVKDSTFDKKKGLNDRELGELESLIFDTVSLLDSDVPEFAQVIYGYLNSLQSHQSFTDILYNQLKDLKNQQASLNESIKKLKIMNPDVATSSSSSGQEERRHDAKKLYKSYWHRRENAPLRNKALIQRESTQRSRKEEEFNAGLQQALIAVRKLLYNERALTRPGPPHSEDFVHYLETVLALKSTMALYSNMGLTSIPSIIGQLDLLQEINFSENELVVLPSEALSLPNLRRLYLHGNKLKALPPLVGCPLLEILDVHNNDLIMLPADIGNLSNLQTIDAFHNKLKTFEQGICDCRKLSYLNLGLNSIKLVPAQLGNLTNLFYLNLKSNPIINLPAHIYAQGTAVTLKFLREHIPENAKIAASSIRSDIYSLLGKSITTSNQEKQDAKTARKINVAKISRDLADLILQSKEGERSAVHSCIVKARCPVIKSAMIQAESNGVELEKNHQGIPIFSLDITTEQLEVLIDYIYGDIWKKPELTLMEPIRGMTEDQLADMVITNQQFITNFNRTCERSIATAKEFKLPYLQNMVEIVLNPKVEPIESTYMADMKPLLFSTVSHDVSFQFPDCPEIVYAHKVILCARSEYFSSMLTGGLIESTQKLIDMKDISCPVFKSMVEFCYTDDVEELSGDTIMDLMMAARLYGLDRLLGIVESVVGYSLDVENAPGIMTTAYIYTLPRLAKACKFFVLSNWNSVTSTEGWPDVPQELQNKLTAIALKWGVIEEGSIRVQ